MQGYKFLRDDLKFFVYVDIIESQAAEEYSSVRLTKVKYNINKRSGVE